MISGTILFATNEREELGEGREGGVLTQPWPPIDPLIPYTNS